ncbi:hypothetical protein SESBI_11852 [Sesbania bispinosa]|nr:hypothetical protein SESBI_11852 [Sesbania bispinosa]
MALLLNKATLPDISKIEPLDGTNYKRWSQKLLIFFEQVEVDYVLFSDAPVIPEADEQAIVEATKALEIYEKYNKFV